jgi:hypothetical protein
MLLLTGPHALRSCALTHRTFQTLRGTGAHTVGAPTVVIQPLVFSTDTSHLNDKPQPADRSPSTPSLIVQYPDLAPSVPNPPNTHTPKDKPRYVECNECVPESAVRLLDLKRVLCQVATDSHSRFYCSPQSLRNSGVYACTLRFVAMVKWLLTSMCKLTPYPY